MSDRLQTGRLRGDAGVRWDVGAVHDQREAVEGRVLQGVLQDDGLEAAPAVDVTQLDSANVVWDGAIALRNCCDLGRRNVQEPGVRIDKAFDEPWARDPIDAGVLSGDPLHRCSSLPLGDWQCL